MPRNRFMGPLPFSLLIIFLCSLIRSASSYSTFPVSSFSYPETKLKPFEWRYLRVELPPWFSSVALTLVSDADIDKGSMEKHSKSTLPIICFRDGSFPLPDASDTALKILELKFPFNGSIGGMPNLQAADQCFSFPKNVTLTLTNNQISPGAWYIGFFNGIGPSRTQSKMISRGLAYTFSADVSVEGCRTSIMWGPFCNQTINLLSCTESDVYTHPRSLLDLGMYTGRVNNVYGHSVQVAPRDGKKESTANPGMPMKGENVITCKNLDEAACVGIDELKVYSLEILDMALELRIVATDVKLNQTSASNTTGNVSEMLIMCYARLNAMPVSTLHDYSSDISKDPLTIPLPKVGRWYIAVHVENHTNLNSTLQEKGMQNSVCFSLEWQVHECPLGKAGPNCTWESHILQRVLKRSPSLPFESYYMPIGGVISKKSANFPLEPLLSNSSFEEKSGVAWTYFLLDVPPGAAGANVHFQMISNVKPNYGIYARYGGLPSIGIWDYYINSTGSSNGSMFLAFNDSSEGKIEFYILYAKEGSWSFGLMNPVLHPFKDQTTISIALDGCPKRCSNHGTCHFDKDGSGSTFYSYCSCDRDHGGFDCNIELVTHKGHIWQSVALIASNGAAILPAFWSLRQKAIAEWVLFTSSGISSGLYHSCDVGTWCILSFRVLQFMDFWLSFMAVVSTFIYMATIDEKSKRAIHTVVAILTALMAITNATRSVNIIIIIAIGVLGLLVGWLIEFSTARRYHWCLSGFRLNIPERWKTLKKWFRNLMKILHKRFRWHFIILGFVALAAAGICWKLETSQSYWIWHSLWHISIYTSSFLFLCSTSIGNRNEGQPNREYELTRQNSSSRGEMENAASSLTNGMT
ncbi:hypothetical protein MRB53_032325 [Persea americana]|uniref:Uncharacterized protein n=1 Tax=Persea americana TaxID=3435 RepID=A0ACC2KS10_PERAE|nr:hypothetical protein MRB53_032325 [Persea americana]